ncbi:uncharacterized protein BT62DRAFT_890739 [Guyanagaster necrorhizus]|uniref:Tetraspanin n=1 Tax=Guyanagaster necrorhizus TaxID=856835 RepID=A0A9P8AUF1_9AGAR|nr:uncharacterized protein BT62DRAFT_890739 [Guyanagaster necrorhizus MCA 3950]KAG7448190.1 hypothetical protein BT62DRAFT_890739 [Guyanagaster necrorhizus MCA 3950]
MIHVHLRKFFFCLPLRMGIFGLSFFEMAGGGIVAAAGWLQVSQLDTHPLAAFDTVALYFHTVVFSLLATVGLFGLISAMTKKRGLVQVYGVLLVIALGVSVTSGIMALYSLFRVKDARTVKQCVNGATDKLTEKVCQNGIAIFKGTGVAIYAVSWVTLSYCYLIAASYAAQLRKDMEDQKTSPVMLMGKTISSPEPLVTYNSVGAPGYNQGYAFSRVREPSNAQAA